MASRYHDDWQSSKKTVLQRNAYMFDNELMSDVSFTCGESSRIFHAHKYVLATSSAVFFALFYENLAEKEFPICIDDAEEESFEEFLRFLYTDACKITAENVIRVMHLAKKYLVSSLAEKCCEILEPDDAFAVLKQAVQFEEKELEEKCWNIVLEKTQECINSEAFCEIGSCTFDAFLKKEPFSLTEMELFGAILKWTDKECERQGINIEHDKTARRRILGDSVYEIPFLAMSLENIVKYVSRTGILTDTEIVSISQKFCGLDVAGLKWKEYIKRQPCFETFSRFDPANIVRSPRLLWSYHGQSDALILVVNKAVLFHGVRLFGSDGGRYEVKFTIKDKNVTGSYTSEQDSDLVPGYDVLLPNPIPLQPNEEITIIATIIGPHSYKGTCGKSSVAIDDVVVTFKDAPPDLSTNGTDKTHGQFYKIFLFEL